MSTVKNPHSQNFPNIATALVTLNNGNITQSWLQFLITLWNRTGANSGGSVVITGSPVAGNLAQFSGSASVTNGDLSGDVSTNGSLEVTLATVNADVGTFGSSTEVPIVTVNKKGLITAISFSNVQVNADALIGTTLASNVVNSSLTGVGTITAGTWDAGSVTSSGAVQGTTLIATNAGSALSPALSIPNAGFYEADPSVIGISAGGVEIGRLSANGIAIGTGTDPVAGAPFQANASGVNCQGILNGTQATGWLAFTYNATANQSPSNTFGHSRGTIAAPTTSVNGDTLGSFRFQGYGATAFKNSVIMQILCIEPSPSDTKMGGSWRLNVAPLGAIAAFTSATEVLRAEQATGFSMYGANPVIDSNRLHILRSFVVSALPSASTSGAGATAFVTDATLPITTGLGLSVTGGGTNKVPVYSDGTNWIIG